MDKYKNEGMTPKRVDKNREMYSELNEGDIESLSLTSNISIIDADTTNLNIEELKSILDKKYAKKKLPDLESLTDESEDLEITKEYDLNKVLDKARNELGSDYEANRHRKRHESEYEILNSLNLKRKSEPEKIESISPEEATLINLIKTVNENELKRNELANTDLDLLGDLKGENDTEVLEPIVLDDEDTLNKPTIIEELEKTKKLSKTDILAGLDEPVKIEPSVKETPIEKSETEDLTNTFYTGKLSIKSSDLNDFSDLQDEINRGSALVKILILLGILVVLALIVVILNKYLNLGLF